MWALMGTNKLIMQPRKQLGLVVPNVLISHIAITGRLSTPKPEMAGGLECMNIRSETKGHPTINKTLAVFLLSKQNNEHHSNKVEDWTYSSHPQVYDAK